MAEVNPTIDVDVVRQTITKPRVAVVDAEHMLSFQKLRVYQSSIDFLALVMQITRALPKGNAGLAEQLLRAAQSQPLNIAEGAGRWTKADQSRFYMHARGSAMEAAAALDALRVMELIEEDLHARGIALLEGIVAMLTKMAR